MTNQDVKQISIRLMPDGFYFSGETYSITPGPDAAKRLEEAILNSGLTDTNAEEIVCSVECLRFNLSPASCDNDTAESMYVMSLSEAENNEILLEQTDQTNSIRMTFGIDAELYHFLRRNLPDIRFCHPLMTLIDEWSGKADNESNSMIAQVEESTVNILIFRKGQLQLANRFATSSNNNCLYYIINVWTQYELDILDDKLYLINAPDDLRKTISNYIKQCE